MGEKRCLHALESCQGYTLVELLAVLLICSILAVVAVPMVDGVIERFVLEEAAWRMARDLREVQQLAVAEQEPYRVQFAWSSNRYIIYNHEGVWAVIYLPPGVTMGSTNFPENRVYFYPSGAPSQGGTIPLKNRLGAERFVKVTVAVGRVRVTTER